MTSWLPALVFIPLVLVLIFWRGRHFLDLWRRMRGGEIDPKDDWDPFR